MVTTEARMDASNHHHYHRNKMTSHLSVTTDCRLLPTPRTPSLTRELYARSAHASHDGTALKLKSDGSVLLDYW
jgi:hypothetical protein